MHHLTKRSFDIAASLVGLLISLPLLSVIAVAVSLTDGLPILFAQERIGWCGRRFVLYKFRTMRPAPNTQFGSFDAGDASRVTLIGRLLRKTKLDELPQLWNVLRGDMSLVGPRPEVEKWVAVYAKRWDQVHRVRPGITDPASIVFRNEEDILAKAPDPEAAYRDEILPRKLSLYEEYVKNRSFWGDLRIIFQTVAAVLGAHPATETAMKKVPFCKVACDGRELEYVAEVLRSGWLTTASKASEFERRFAEMVGAKFACAVNSCTAALHLALEAVGVGPGQSVFVPTMTFTASAEVIRYLGADPICLDVEYGSSLLTPDILEQTANRYPDVKTLVLVHFGGQAAEMVRPDSRGILDVCRRRGIRVIEDAAHAFPARWANRMIGSFGDATCFSFYANKTITTGEGGMLATDDEEVYERAKVMRLHGIDRDVWGRFTADRPSWEYDVVAPGFKYNLTDLAAAIGLAQLERAEEFRDERERCAQFYLRELAGVSGIDLPTVRVPMADHAWHLFQIILGKDASVSRNRFIELLAEQGVGTSVHYKPLHRMTYYRQRYGLRAEDFPNAERIWRGCVSLPIYPALSDDDLEYVCRTIRQTLQASDMAHAKRAA